MLCITDSVTMGEIWSSFSVGILGGRRERSGLWGSGGEVRLCWRSAHGLRTVYLLAYQVWF